MRFKTQLLILMYMGVYLFFCILARDLAGTKYEITLDNLGFNQMNMKKHEYGFSILMFTLLIQGVVIFQRLFVTLKETINLPVLLTGLIVNVLSWAFGIYQFQRIRDNHKIKYKE